VLVDGQIVYRDGTFPRLPDSARVKEEAGRVARQVLDHAGLAHRLQPEWRH
jgi:hypothetical protein